MRSNKRKENGTSSLLECDGFLERRCGEAAQRDEAKRNRASCFEFKDNFIFLVAMRLGETPVHIPNTMVKTQAADDTILVTVWESRWLPDLKRNFMSDQRFHENEVSYD